MKYSKMMAIQLVSMLFIFLILALWIHEARSGNVTNCQGASNPCTRPIYKSCPSNCTLWLWCPDQEDCGSSGSCYDAGYKTGYNCYENTTWRCRKVRCDCEVTQGFTCKINGYSQYDLSLICPSLEWAGLLPVCSSS